MSVAGIKVCTCKNCGRAFETAHRRKFCNVVCQMAKRRARFGQHTCQHCHSPYWATGPNQVACSRACSVRLQQTTQVQGTCDRCGTAYTRMVQPHVAHQVRYCSEDCKERHVHTTKRHRRRMQMQGTSMPCEDITVAGLHARDRGVCHLCRQPVDLSLKGRQSKAPSIDHLIPLSKGGSHQWSNVALAHFGCNCRKCDADEAALLVLRT